MPNEIENLINLDREDFLNELFSLVDFEDWEKDILISSVKDYETDDEILKLFDEYGYLLADIEIHLDGELEILSTYFDGLREM